MGDAMRKLFAATLVIVLAACAGPTISSSATFAPGSPDVSPATSPGPSPGLSPGVLPTGSPPAPSAPPVSAQILPPGAAVEVAVRELNLRETPSTSGKRVKILRRGDVLLISPTDQRSFGWGPVRANGYDWYPVVVAAGSGDGQLPALPASPVDLGVEVPVSGWVAFDERDRPFLAPLPPRCPTTIDLVNVQGMLPAERLACFGGPITLEGTFGCGGCGGAVAGEFRPAWLASPLNFDFLSVDVTQRYGPVALHFHPDGPSRPTPGSIVRVTVHVDDARATRCTMTDGVGSDATRIDDRTAVLYCRERFVVDSFEVLGTDPDFGFS
jgi:hypothetical protein